MALVGNPSITIIQGDSYTNEVSIDGIEREFIEGVYFSCSYLSLSIKLDYDDKNDLFLLSLTPEDTKKLKVCRCNYDITIKFTENTIKTLYHNAPLQIKKKTNEVNYGH